MNVACYSRLSSEKGDNISIENQNSVISNYIALQKDLCNATFSRFEDSGYSGINLDRPAFSRLMTAIKSRKIDCLIIKDFSRLSRNYLDLCRLTESFLPFMRVRIISVTENYDSDKISHENTEISVAFRAILNEFHVVETSTKILKTYRTKLLQGNFYGGLPFGYVFSEDRKPIVIEENAAIVREIFQRKSENYSSSEISGMLNSRGIPAPKGGLWSTSTINGILKNSDYMGVKISRKRRVDLKTKRSRKSNVSETIVNDTAFFPIIDKELFDSVQANRICSITHRKENIFARKIYCIKCGKTLVKNNISFSCNNRYKTGGERCFDGRLSVELLSISVLEKVKFIINTELKKHTHISFSDRQKTESNIALLKEKRGAVFENFADGKISEDDFQSAKNSINTDISTLESKLVKYSDDTAFYAKQQNGESVYSVLKRLSCAEDLTAEHIFFVEKILVTNAEKFEVILKQNSPIEIVLENINIYEVL